MLNFALGFKNESDRHGGFHEALKFKNYGKGFDRKVHILFCSA